ncbi:DUF3099 domain-containing protein [Mycobacterium sp. M1]|uniref:DUF3099 domain-containing protein n=1 Tax=Mycolicibacter acidiphilus TaxID=2835306 RepID=A0ABS5RCX9_9MYCO|nr:DUF3099 domain-containing protein [Mycolicibacter acidiphilus]MBS9532019.1 DUF3099 domain-containing protein [Mycolicibacter acidiphilus]
MWDSGAMEQGPQLGFDDDGQPVLITTAAPSYEQQHRERVRKYLTMMAFRVPALLLAALAYGAWHNGLISLAILAASIPLPWMAVLIANDRPPRRPDEPRRYDAEPRNIPLFPGPAHLALEESWRQQPPSARPESPEPPETDGS